MRWKLAKYTNQLMVVGSKCDVKELCNSVSAACFRKHCMQGSIGDFFDLNSRLTPAAHKPSKFKCRPASFSVVVCCGTNRILIKFKIGNANTNEKYTHWAQDFAGQNEPELGWVGVSLAATTKRHQRLEASERTLLPKHCRTKDTTNRRSSSSKAKPPSSSSHTYHTCEQPTPD